MEIEQSPWRREFRDGFVATMPLWLADIPFDFPELLAALPHPLFDGAVLEAVLGDRQPDVTRMRTERMMEKRQHGP